MGRGEPWSEFHTQDGPAAASQNLWGPPRVPWQDTIALRGSFSYSPSTDEATRLRPSKARSHGVGPPILPHTPSPSDQVGPFMEIESKPHPHQESSAKQPRLGQPLLDGLGYGNRHHLGRPPGGAVGEGRQDGVTQLRLGTAPEGSRE